MPKDWRRLASLAGIGLAGGLAIGLGVAIATTGLGGLAGATTVDDFVLDYVDDVLGTVAARRVMRHIDEYWPTLLLTMMMVISAPGGLARRQAIHFDPPDSFWAWWKPAFLLWGIQGAVDLLGLHHKLMMGYGWYGQDFLRMVRFHWHILLVISAASALMAMYYRMRQGRWPADLQQLVRILVIVLISSVDWVCVGFLYLN